MRLSGTSSLVLAVAIGLAPRADAYVCSPLSGENALPLTQVWQSRCIPFWVSTSGGKTFKQQGTAFIPTGLVDCSGCFLKTRVELVSQSFAQWSSSLNRCTDLVFESRGLTTELNAFDSAKPYEQQNVIGFIEDKETWDKEVGQRSLLAVTNTTYATQTGEILDADIIVDGAYFMVEEVMDPVACRTGVRSFDIRNTLVHEIGHFIGFDHTTGADATMFESADACEIKKRDLAQDDKDGLCSVYPAGRPSKACKAPATYEPSGGSDPTPYRNQCTRVPPDPAKAGGCSATGGDGSGLVALLVLATARRRGRRA